MILDELRARCASIAAAARFVSIVSDRLPAYARSPAVAAVDLPPDADAELLGADPETTAAFWLCLDAINFGSGWFPTLRKRPGRSGYFAVAIPLRERFTLRGAWSPAELAAIDAAEVASVLGQDPEHELMALFATSLRCVGEYVGDRSWLSVALRPRAEELVERLAGWPCFADPLLKRAQLAAWDLHRSGVVAYGDVGQLTCFADNLVPHVLRVDGVLALSAALAARIDRGELLEHGSPEEVELRACAVHAVELIVAELRDGGRPGATAAEVDLALWNRGQAPRYRATPRPRCRCAAY